MSRARRLAALLALLAGCAAPAAQAPSTRTATAPPPSRPEAASPQGEASVRPGVNDKYYEDGAAQEWRTVFEGESREVASRRDEIVAALDLRPGLVVADVGTGTGLFVEPLARAIEPDGRLLAVDIVPGFLELVRARVAEWGLNNVELHQAQPRDVGLTPASVDLAFMCNVYHHVEYPQSFMRSVATALKPDARLVLVDFERIPGKTSPRMIKHVRADKATVIAEVEAAGFVLEEEIELLRENYVLRFRLADTP